MRSENIALGTAISNFRTQIQADATGLNNWKNTFSSADQARPLSEFIGQNRHKNNRYMRMLLDWLRNDAASG